MSNIGVNVGRDVLRLPGTNGDRRFEGGTPLSPSRAIRGTGWTRSPCPTTGRKIRSSTVLNATWNKGKHSLRFASRRAHYQGIYSVQPDKVEPSAVKTAEGSALLGLHTADALVGTRRCRSGDYACPCSRSRSTASWI